MGEAPRRFGERLRGLREGLGLSQERLAERLGYSVDALGRRERGQITRLPSETEVEGWAKQLGLDPHELKAILFNGLDPDHLGDGTVARVRPRLPQALNRDIAAAKKFFYVWQTWIPQDVQFVDAVSSAVQAGAEVRFLLMNPCSSSAAERAARLGYRANDLVVFMQSLIVSLRVAGVAKPSRAIRLSEELPISQVYATEKSMYIGWFYPDKASTIMSQVEVARTASIATTFLQYFQATWDSLVEPDLSQYDS